jgi:hypothetical protein
MAPKLIQAMPGMSKPVTEAEVERFLESKLNLQLATLDNEGYPKVWGSRLTLQIINT